MNPELKGARVIWKKDLSYITKTDFKKILTFDNVKEIYVCPKIYKDALVWAKELKIKIPVVANGGVAANEIQLWS